MFPGYPIVLRTSWDGELHLHIYHNNVYNEMETFSVVKKGCKTSHFCVGFQTEMRLKDGRGGNTGGEIERRFYPVVTGETLYRVHYRGGRGDGGRR